MTTKQINSSEELVFDAMGTTVHVIVNGCVTSGRDDLSIALETARTMIERAEDRWSRFRPSSELSQINTAAGHPVRVSDATFELLSTAMLGRDATNGAFDPTLGACLVAAGYDRPFSDLEANLDSRESRLQDDRAGTKRPDTAPTSRFAAPYLEPFTRTVTVPVGTRLDLGGIAKGATADAVAERLIRDGMAGCCVSIGGDIRVRGAGPENGRWRIDLECPGSTEQRSILLSDGGVCTSSISKRSWLNGLDGGTTHHLIDPTTGLPRVGGPTTTTVIAATATAAEVLTKWVMAGGDPQAFEATGLIVDSEGDVHAFAGFDLYQADVKQHV